MAFNVRYVINIAYEYLSLTYQRMVVLDLVVQDECHPFGAVSFGKVLRTRSNAVVFVADGFNNQECRRFEARSSGKYSMPMARACDSCWCALVLAAWSWWLSVRLRSVREGQALFGEKLPLPPSELLRCLGDRL